MLGKRLQRAYSSQKNRDICADYFMNERAVEWQWKKCETYLIVLEIYFFFKKDFAILRNVYIIIIVQQI